MEDRQLCALRAAASSLVNETARVIEKPREALKAGKLPRCEIAFPARMIILAAAGCDTTIKGKVTVMRGLARLGPVHVMVRRSRSNSLYCIVDHESVWEKVEVPQLLEEDRA